VCEALQSLGDRRLWDASRWPWRESSRHKHERTMAAEHTVKTVITRIYCTTLHGNSSDNSRCRLAIQPCLMPWWIMNEKRKDLANPSLTPLIGCWTCKRVMTISEQFTIEPISMPSVLWRCWLGGRKGIRPVKNWVVGCWHDYLSGMRCRFAHAQLMPLPLTISCYSKSTLVLPSWFIPLFQHRVSLRSAVATFLAFLRMTAYML